MAEGEDNGTEGIVDPNVREVEISNEIIANLTERHETPHDVASRIWTLIEPKLRGVPRQEVAFFCIEYLAQMAIGSENKEAKSNVIALAKYFYAAYWASKLMEEEHGPLST
jgi:hypothetical protein